MSSSPDRELLLGLIALMHGFVSRDQLWNALKRWQDDKHRSLESIFVEQNALDTSARSLLAALVDKHLANHGGNCKSSLMALSSFESELAELKATQDPSLTELFQSMGATDYSMERATKSVGETASRDQSLVMGQTRRSGSGGEVIRFQILRPHASGGLGTVSVAFDRELPREVALKEIKPKYAASVEAQARFVREAEITGSLEHPGIVPVYGLGHYSDGRPFYAMKFIRGDSLLAAITAFHEQLQAGTVSFAGIEFRKLLQRFVDVCQAMQYAHDRGVLHRDLKPGNIMLGQYGETLVVDWGLAKSQSQADSADQRTEDRAVGTSSGTSGSETQPGSAIGTPAYMSPEQAAGRIQELGPTTDVYSLGATLYHLLAGQPSIKGKSREETLQCVMNGDIAPPRSLIPSIPAALEAICKKAMQLAPSNRYSSPQAFSADVERFLADEPIDCFKEPLSTQTRRFVRRHQVPVTGGLATVVVAAIALGILFAFSEASNRTIRSQNQLLVAARNDAEDERMKAVESAQEAARQASVAQAVSSFLRYDLLSQASIGKQSAAAGGRNSDMRVRELLDRAASAIGSSLAEQPAVEAAIRVTIGNTYRGLGVYDKAEEQLNAARKVVEGKLSKDDPTTLECLSDIVSLLTDQGRYDEAELLQKDLIVRWEQLYGEEHPSTIRCRIQGASIDRNKGRMALAEEGYLKALDLQRKVLGPDHPSTLSTMNSLAILYSATARFEEAEKLEKEALDGFSQRFGPDYPMTLTCMSSLAGIYLERGRYADAEKLYKECFGLSSKKLGARHPDTLSYADSLSRLYLKVGKFGEAAEVSKEVVAGRRATLGDRHHKTLIAMGNLAEVYRMQSKLDEAEKLYLECIAGTEELFGKDHVEYFLLQNNLGLLYREKGRYAEAEKYLKASIEGRSRLTGETHPDTLKSRSNLAGIYRIMMRFADAEEIYRQVIKDQTELFGEQHIDVSISTANLATVLIDQKRGEEAEPLLLKAMDAMQKVVGPNSPQALQQVGMLGDLYSTQGRFKEAEPLLVKCYEGQLAQMGEGHPRTLSAMSNLSKLYANLGRNAEAEDFLKRFVAINTKQLGEDHPSTLLGMVNLVLFYYSVQREPESDPYLELIVKGLRARMSPAVGKLMPKTTEMLQRRKLYTLAEPLLREWAELQVAQSPKTTACAEALSAYGVNQVLLRHDQEATAAIEKAIEITSALSGPSSDEMGNIYAQWGDALSKVENWSEAEIKLRKAIEIRVALPTPPPTLFTTRSTLGHCLTMQKKYQEAEPELLAASTGLTKRMEEKKSLALTEVYVETLRRIVGLYERWPKEDQLSAWQERLNEATSGK